MASAFFWLIPFTVANFCGENSIISKVSPLNLSTMASAVTGPTPFIKPLDKYLFIPSIELG